MARLAQLGIKCQTVHGRWIAPLGPIGALPPTTGASFRGVTSQALVLPSCHRDSMEIRIPPCTTVTVLACPRLTAIISLMILAVHLTRWT